VAGEQSGSFEVRKYPAFRSHVFTPYACLPAVTAVGNSILASEKHGATAASDPTLASEQHVCATLTSLQQLTVTDCCTFSDVAGQKRP